MQVSATAEYALRAMACLVNADGDTLTSDDLAELGSIPRHYVSKVMRQLVVAGIVEARRGRGGGFRLTRPPGDINYAEVLAAVGGLADPTRCAFGHEHCNPDEPCPLHPAWARLQELFEAWAASSTLDETAQDPPRPT
jgi:Rrf2 family protein